MKLYMIKIDNKDLANYIMFKLDKEDNNFSMNELGQIDEIIINPININGEYEKIDLEVIKFFLNLKKIPYVIRFLISDICLFAGDIFRQVCRCTVSAFGGDYLSRFGDEDFCFKARFAGNNPRVAAARQEFADVAHAFAERFTDNQDIHIAAAGDIFHILFRYGAEFV